MSARYQVLQSGGVFDLEASAIVLPGSAEWAVYQEWLTAGNVVLPPDTIGQDDLPTSKAKRKAEIDAYAAALRNKVVRGRSAGEMASWAIKINEARAYNVSHNDAQAPTLFAIAQIRGISTQLLVDKVLAQATPFLQAEAAIDGIRGKHCDVVDAMTDVPSIVTYDWHTGWPPIP